MKPVEGEPELTPRPTGAEMRNYILQILNELHGLSVDYGLRDLAQAIAVARDVDRCVRQ